MNFLKRIKFTIKTELARFGLCIIRSKNAIHYTKEITFTQKLILFIPVLILIIAVGLSMIPVLVASLIVILQGTLTRYLKKLYKKIRRQLK